LRDLIQPRENRCALFAQLCGICIGKYALAGGASNAAGMVAQWYLQHAQNLAPTVAVGSGRDVWIVIKDKVSLPEEFFKKERKNGDEGIYSYFTRVLE
jgi:hypothetical protein